MAFLEAATRATVHKRAIRTPFLMVVQGTVLVGVFLENL
jgi:hypothetical protein